MKDYTRKTLKIYWQFTWHYRLYALIVFIGVIGASLLQVITPLYMKKFFDVLASNSQSSGMIQQLLLILVMIAIIEFSSWLCWRSLGFSLVYFTAHVMADLANFCFANLHKHSFTFFNNNFVGTLVKRVQWFVKSYENISDRIIFDLTTMFINIVFIVIVLWSRNMYLGVVMVVWTLVFLVVNYSFSKYKYKYDVARSQAQSEASGYLADTVTNNTNVKLFNAYEREKNGYAAAQEKVRKLETFTWGLNEVFNAIQGLFMIGLEIGIFYLAIRLWQKNLLTVGDFVLIQAYLINLFNRIWNFGRTIMKIYEGLSDAEEMMIILDTPLEIKDVLNAKNLQIKEGKIEFKEVSFYYHQTRAILKKLNLIIKPGERVALIGPSGAGKTTIAKLILRQHEVPEGKILIDGQNIARVTQESLWQNISLVPQDPILFHRPLLENIKYGQPEASLKQVELAAKAANCHEFIADLPQGYQTFVGERGIKLSGGERQRVAIARAILHNAPILILDEATSSLDSESEMLIQQALDKLMADKTVIVIAHRLSTIRKMDRIIVIDEGTIVEEGTHDKLLTKKSGIYRKLWELQAGGFIQ